MTSPTDGSTRRLRVRLAGHGLRRRLSIVAVLVAIVGGLTAGLASASIPAPNGVIHSCYKTSTGAVSVVNSAKVHKCPAGSKGLNWNQTGPAGTARDAGNIYSVDQGSGTPGFQPDGLKGWRKVTSTGTGEYCLTPDATSTQANTSLLLSLGGVGGGDPGFVVWEGYCDSSTGLELAVQTYDSSGTLSNSIPFEAVIP
jgi:hypothetical protein